MSDPSNLDGVEGGVGAIPRSAPEPADELAAAASLTSAGRRSLVRGRFAALYCAGGEIQALRSGARAWPMRPCPGPVDPALAIYASARRGSCSPL